MPRRSGPRTILYSAWAPFFSGAERALLVLVDHLDPARYRPVVALGTRGELEAELRRRGVRTLYAPVRYRGLRELPAWLASVAGLARIGRAERAALVHANDVPSFQPAGYAARLLGRPTVTHVRFPDSRAGFEWFLKPGFARAVFVSAALRDAALAEAPTLFGDRSEVVHDGVLTPDVPDEGARRALRHELGLAAEDTIVAFTGQISAIKGIWEFIDAAAILVGRGVPATFAILGDDLRGKGALRREAERAVTERQLGQRVRFLGFRPDAPRLIAAFDVVAVPSHVEPLGNATLEAMAAGRPVVGSRVGGIPEMVVDGVTGLLVPPGNAAELAGALEGMVRDPERIRSFGRAGRARATRCFSAAAHADRVQALYDRLLETRS